MRLSIRSTRWLWLALVVALATIRDVPADCTTATQTTATQVYATSVMDTALNGSSKEDTAFFSTTTTPSVFFLLDNSGSMKRLPPNGPAYYPGLLPTLRDTSCSGGDTADPACGFKNLGDPMTNDYNTTTNKAVVGCGDDTTSSADATASTRKLPVIIEAGSTYTDTLFNYLKSRTYSPPCGIARDGSPVLGHAYDATRDYALEANRCPHFTGLDGSGNVLTTTGDSGFDPDFYCGSGSVNTTPTPNTIASSVQTCSATTNCGGTCTAGRGNFFDKNLVFHDSTSDVGTGSPADGWSTTGVVPWTTGGVAGSVAQFCAQYGTKMQGTQKKADICNSCLTTRGFFLDGNMWRKNEEGRSDSPEMPYPSIWYTGNYLNFWPPKFIVQRKVMKDILMGKPAIRTALGKFSGNDLNTTDIKLFSPACDGTVPSTTTDFLTFINALNYDQGTPLAQAMLDVGKIFHSPSVAWFGSGTSTNVPATASVCYACQPNYLVVVTDGQPKPDDGFGTLPTGTVVAGDIALNSANSTTKKGGDSSTGIRPTTCVAAPSGFDSSAASYTGANGCSGGGIDFSLCKDCWTFPSVVYGTGYRDYKNNPIRVSYYMSHLDLRKDDDSTGDCAGMAGNQFLTTYTVGFGVEPLPDASKLLKKTAQVSGGNYYGAESPEGLRQSLTQLIERVSGNASTFGVSSISTLQTISGSSVIVPRFEPGRSTAGATPGGNVWKGHLYRLDMKSEFVAGCTPGGTGDLDCDGKCSSVFLVDADGDYVIQDANGMYKKSGNALPSCNDQSAPTCGTCGGFAGPVDANPWWEAGKHIAGTAGTSTQLWKARRIYTALPSTAGAFDNGAVTTRVATDNATVTSLLPYLQVTSATCAAIQSQIDAAGDHKTAALLAPTVDTTKLACATEIVRYVLGADVFNERKLPSYPNTLATDATAPDRDGVLPDRTFMLGDIFHSAPVLVDPPLPSDGVLCPRGLHNQCLPSLWKTPVPHSPANANAYDGYSKSSYYEYRNKIVLVGANDGLLHAFLDSVWQPNGRDPALYPAIDTSVAPYNGYYDRKDAAGSPRGVELWAFLPPDLLPKIPDMLFGHQFYVDGTPMVRDVWADGTSNQVCNQSSADGSKQSCEFHTVAVVPERRGGTHYFALDITDATEVISDGNESLRRPKFLWMYPPAASADALSFGETYAEFLPTPPPIGPVRLAAASGPTMTTSSGATVHYKEKWIVMLSGGFDMEYVRGRGVHMVDVWTGDKIWNFTGRKSGETLGASDPRNGLVFPIAAPVGMVMWGTKTSHLDTFANDGYFDTATFGDTGGQLWVVRFSDPGTNWSTTSPVDNWFGARVFQMGGQAGLCSSEPFFYITANTAVGTDYTYRVLAGTGDRYNLLDTKGGVCGPDNIRACVQQGCTVSSTTDPAAVIGDIGATGVGDYGWTIGAGACGGAGGYTVTPTSASAPTCSATGRARISVTSCPTTILNAASTVKDVSVSCAPNSGDASFACATTGPRGADIPLKSGATTAITQKNYYFSLKVFEASGARAIFADSAGAQAYDAARLSESSTGIKTIDGTTNTPAVSSLATTTDKGWAMLLQHSGNVTIGSTTYSLSALDERVASTSAVVDDCAYFNTMQPPYASTTTAGCTVTTWGTPVCNAQNKRMNYFYGADTTTGGVCLATATGSVVRSVRKDRLVPPPAPQYTVFVNAQGQALPGLPSVNSDDGAENQYSGAVSDAVSTYGNVPLSRSGHDCRHAADATGAASACK